MIKEALRYVAELATEAQGIITEEINGETYIKGDAKRIPTDKAETLSLNTLQATVDYIRDCIRAYNFVHPFIVDINDRTVTVRSGMNCHMERNTMSITKPTLPSIALNQYMDMEEFIIQLKTCFVESDNLNKLAQLVSSITDKSEVKVEDDGFSMTVSQTSGTAIKKAEELHINPIVRLAPYRTYMELEQPESKFLLRVLDGGRMALYEADGGMWKLEAQRKISEYLRNELSGEIESGTVVVLG